MIGERSGRFCRSNWRNDGEDVFAKIKGLISDMITELEGEAESDVTGKAYCDEESRKTDLESTVDFLTTKIDRAGSKSAGLKEDVNELQGELAALAKETAEMDQMRKAKADLELGLNRVPHLQEAS